VIDTLQQWISKRRLGGARVAMAFAVVLALGAVATQSAQAQRFKTLHEFKGYDGKAPDAALIRDPEGNLYGTTAKGGASGAGTVFKVDKLGKETVLYSFTGYKDGLAPAGVILDAKGNLYGTTSEGGDTNCQYPNGCGVVFKLERSGKEIVLYTFREKNKGGVNPQAGLVRDMTGTLYGTTYSGGTFGQGTVFEVDRDGRESVLYSFTGYPSDGGGPQGGLIMDAKGNLYGTTSAGGTSTWGTVFMVDQAGKETVLHNFGGAPNDGGQPSAGLIFDEDGNLYGTTQLGGSGGCSQGCGTVFKLDTTGAVTILYNFPNRNEAWYPSGGLVRDGENNLYGTTPYGGRHENGTVFELSTAGNLTVLHRFSGNGDGAVPLSGVMRDRTGALYGTTSSGGVYNCQCGTVFKITP
jgi:uncharacterized repeat protein (TIGR03803 family)